MTINDIIKEGIDDIREWKPGVYIIHTDKAWEEVRNEVADGRNVGGWYASTPEWIKEINRRHIDAIRHSNPNIEKYI